MHRNMQELEQYSDSQFVLKGVVKGAQSESVVLFLKPGQEMPPHPHDRFEVILVPHQGQGVMTVDGAKDVTLRPNTFYFEPAGRTFRIRNTGETNLQVLIVLVRVGEPPSGEAAP